MLIHELAQQVYHKSVKIYIIAMIISQYEDHFSDVWLTCVIIMFTQ